MFSENKIAINATLDWHDNQMEGEKWEDWKQNMAKDVE